MVTLSELGDVGEGPGERCLFFLTVYCDPGIRLTGDRVTWPVEHLAVRGVWCALNNH